MFDKNLVANITFGFDGDTETQVKAQFIFRKDGTASVSMEGETPEEVPGPLCPKGGRTDTFLDDFMELFALAYAIKCVMPPMPAAALL